MEESTISFEQKFAKLIAAIKENVNLTDVSSHFSSEKSLIDMFKYFTQLDEVKDNLTIEAKQPTKNEEKATEFRNQGNQYYRHKKLDKALEFYNKSILISPHPDIKSISDFAFKENCQNFELIKNNYDLENKEFKSIALSLANRSAVLFELKQYEKCILDCDMSILYGYPKILASKLAERKAKCYLALNNKIDAKSTLEKCIEDLNNLDLDKDKIIDTKNSIEKLINQCSNASNEQTSNNKDTPKLYSENNLPIEKLFNFGIHDPPKMPERNETIPNLSKAVRVDYAPDRGRYLVADRDILPGEVLVSEKSYSSAVLFECLESHCSYCIKRTRTPLPCLYCSKVVFCSEECRINGLNKFHLVECNLLDRIEELDLGKNGQLVVRLVVETTFDKVKETALNYKVDEIDPKLVGFNEDGIYDSTDYRAVYGLVTNKSQRLIADLFKRTAISYVLCKLLLSGKKFFSDKDFTFTKPSEDDFALIGSVVTSHLMHVPCNAHCITEFEVCYGNIKDSLLIDVGAGAYPVLSLVNHSCYPSAARTSFGNMELLRAISFIPAGTEIFDSYGKHFAFQDTFDRKSLLKKQYYFNCSCEPCTNHWPMYERLHSVIKMKCINCPGTIDSPRRMCYDCKTSYSEPITQNGKIYDLCSLSKKIDSYIMKYEEVYKFVLLGDSSEESVTFLENFITMFKDIKLPVKGLIEAQETLKHCYDKCSTYFHPC